MGIIEDLQEARKRAERNGTQGAKFLVNQKTYNALCRRGADKSMLIVSELAKDGDCVEAEEIRAAPEKVPALAACNGKQHRDGRKGGAKSV